MLSTLIAALAFLQPQPGIITITADDTVIDRSCTIRIPPGMVIADVNGDGVVHIAADGITIAFEAGSMLQGSPAASDPDTFAGTGIRLDNRKDVTIRGARVAGYKVGIRATRAPGLTINTADLSGNYRQRLLSTPKAENPADWLWPHTNDGDEWTTTYGAALSIKEASNITLRNIRVRHSQNGIILDRVTDSKVYDNDCSFLSGWGLALWRSSRNTITNNALDFCVRGYSHGVYNRGQDSAGLLIFEQCDDNLIAHNSITHGGDGIFGFGGREAIGETPPPGADFTYTKRGNRGNIIAHNDLSYAPAHGLEMTFSFDQTITDNRFIGNAICGIWGGYSQNFLIAENAFEGNGEMAYGLERGGINMEHASGNRILENRFKANKCGVHLWWDNDAALLEKPGVRTNYRGVTGNIIAGNTFNGDRVGIQIRDTSEDKSNADGNTIVANAFTGVAQELAVDPEVSAIVEGSMPEWSRPTIAVLGNTRPVGARRRLAGRENIIMTQWGPWDHQGPLIRAVNDSGDAHTYEVFNISPADISTSGIGLSVEQQIERPGGAWRLSIRAAAPGVTSYTISVHTEDLRREIRGTLLRADWNLRVFPWKGDGGPNPPADLASWRALAAGPGSLRATADRLAFAFGSRGPSELDISPRITSAKLKPDYFGIIATADIPLSKGRWKITTQSDDGIRLAADGTVLIENWTHHGATTDTATLDLEDHRTVAFTVEYFEIYGGAILDVQITPAP